eukprot:c11095_g1_i1 orf=126-413(+)
MERIIETLYRQFQEDKWEANQHKRLLQLSQFLRRAGWWTNNDTHEEVIDTLRQVLQQCDTPSNATLARQGEGRVHQKFIDEWLTKQVKAVDKGFA